MLDAILGCAVQSIEPPGCAVGRLARYLAERFAAQVVGVTLCESHVELAARFAGERGVGWFPSGNAAYATEARAVRA